jgi:hypothetical protein
MLAKLTILLAVSIGIANAEVFQMKMDTQPGPGHELLREDEILSVLNVDFHLL